MRITNGMLVNNMVNYIGNNLSRMEKYQYQLATGKKIQMPSDDPVVAARSLKLRTDVAQIEQYKKNVEDAQSWLDITETAVGNVGDIFTRVRELTVDASNGTKTQDDLNKIKSELQQLKIQLTHVANTTYAGRYIFSGYQTNKPLMDENGVYTIDVANTELIKYEVGIGDDMNINILGGDLFNIPSTNAVNGNSARMIQSIDNLLLNIDSGESAAISASLGDIDSIVENILRIRSDIGARQNRLDLTSNRLENDYLNFSDLMSKNEDVDEAETIMYLTNEEYVYKASLAGGARIIQPSLVDFLK